VPTRATLTPIDLKASPVNLAHPELLPLCGACKDKSLGALIPSACVTPPTVTQARGLERRLHDGELPSEVGPTPVCHTRVYGTEMQADDKSSSGMTNNVTVSQSHGHRGNTPAPVRPPRPAALAATKAVRFVEPGSSRGGRRFEPMDELHLHDLVESLAASLPGQGDNVLVVPEMPSPLGLPDFVALVGGRGWLDARMTADVPPLLSEIDCAVLAALSPVRPLGTESVARRIGWTPNEVQGVIARLAKVDAIRVTANGAAQLHPALRPLGSVVAVEAKVKEWRRAVLQGRSYRTWADNYVVVLGNVGATAQARAKEGIRSDGGGLFTDTGWVVRPRSRQPAAARRLQGFEYFFAAISSGPAL
jgi:hypothetical protein